jgi:hypothetical protein
MCCSGWTVRFSAVHLPTVLTVLTNLDNKQMQPCMQGLGVGFFLLALHARCCFASKVVHINAHGVYI